MGWGVPLHFHPFIMRNVILSTTSYHDVRQLTGHRQLTTMLEGCFVRPVNAPESCVIVNRQVPKTTESTSCVVRSIYIAAAGGCSEDGGPKFLVNFIQYLPMISRFVHAYFKMSVSALEFTDDQIAAINVFVATYYVTAMNFKRPHIGAYPKSVWPVVAYGEAMAAIDRPPLLPLPETIRWFKPALYPGKRIHWNIQTPVRWTRNTSDTAFIAVNTSVYPITSLGDHDAKMRLREFERIHVQQHRSMSTGDGGHEAEWARHVLGGVLGGYNRPDLNPLQLQMLGVDPALGIMCSWDEVFVDESAKQGGRGVDDIV